MTRSKGSLTVEASIGLTAFIFLILVILGLHRAYEAQSIVSHATLQTSQALAVESYFRETMASTDIAGNTSKFISFLSELGLDVSGADDWYDSLGASGTELEAVIKETFAYAVAKDVQTANNVLKSVGIEDGIDGLDFSNSSVTGSEIIINVRYTLDLPFSVWGDHKLYFYKSAKTKSFKKIDDDNGI